MVPLLNNRHTISIKDYYLIQCFAAFSLLGYWLAGAVIGTISGAASTLVNVTIRAVIATLAVVIIFRNHKELHIERGKAIYTFYFFIMIAYSLRMLCDMVDGPFTEKLSSTVFFNDMMTIILGCFLTAVALIASRRYLDIDKIAKIVFWMGLVTILLSRNIMSSSLGANAYETDRVNLGSSLHSLSLVRIGAFEVISAVHLLINREKIFVVKIMYLVGIVLGLWLALASGARGGLVALVIALGVYFFLSVRHNPGMSIIAIFAALLFILNLVPILNWVSNFFPVFGNRMLQFVVEQDESNRDLLRQAAYNFIMENPILGFSYRLRADLTGYTSHNGILDIALALGIPIAIMFVYFFYYKVFVMSAKILVDKNFFFPAVMALFSIIASLSSSSITNEGWHFSMCILLSAYYYHYNSNKKQILRNSYGKQ